MSVQTKASVASFGGKLLNLAHNASTTKCEMNFKLFIPPQAQYSLTCTADNGAEKGFFQHAASEQGIAVLYPDTSPRGLGIQGEDADWDFGTGAGFYVDATKAPWSQGYKMYSYITKELPDTVLQNFPQIDGEKISIMGHSMGGHGALTLFLRNPGKYRSVSAFAPIANPCACPWGQKAFSGYFGTENRENWAEHDATELVKKWEGEDLDILIDVGTEDSFYAQQQLLPENFAKAAKGKGRVNLRMQEGYDHRYYFVASFARDHVMHAAKHLLR